MRVVEPPAAVALVIALHGAGGSGQEFERTTGFDAEGRRRHFAVAYPDGLDRHWNAGFCCPFGNPHAIDDVAFLAALIDRVARPGWPVFVAGYSNGGMMAYHLACQIPARIAAIAVVGADSEECAPNPPLPRVLAIQGSADQLAGNRVWARRNGAWVNSEPSATARWQRLGATVELMPVEGGVHTWFRGHPDATAEAAAFFAAGPPGSSG